MALFAAKSPVDAREQQWIERSMSWFRTEFGEEPLRRPTVLPTADFLPGHASTDASDIRATVAQVCRYASVDPGKIMLEFYGDFGEGELVRATGLAFSAKSAAGHYRRENGRAIIGIDKTLAATPVRLIATVAHELGHVRLLDEGRITPDREDHEPLTDLLTVYLGLGIFAANARFDYTRNNHGYSTAHLGYLTEPMVGYGLACRAWLCGETRPSWMRYVDTNPRAYLKRGLRYLAAHADARRLPTTP